jgi:hypothetical protein
MVGRCNHTESQQEARYFPDVGFMNWVRRTSNRGYVATVNVTRHAGLYPRSVYSTFSANCPFRDPETLNCNVQSSQHYVSSVFMLHRFCVLSLREYDKGKDLNSEHLAHVSYHKSHTTKQNKRSGAFARFSHAPRSTFRSTTDRIYDGGPIRLYTVIIWHFNI